MFNLKRQFEFDTSFRIVSTAQALNRLLYFFRKIPFVGEHLHHTAFSRHKMKSGISYVLLVLSYLQVFFWRVIFLIGSLLLATHANIMFIAKNLDQALTQGLIAWVILAAITFPFLISFSGKGGVSKGYYDFVDWFALDYRLAVFEEFFQKAVTISVFYGVILLLIGGSTGHFLLFLNAWLIYLVMNTLAVAAKFWSNRKTKSPKSAKSQKYMNNILTTGTLVLFVGATLFVLFFNNLQMFVPFLGSWITAVGLIVLFVGALFLTKKIVNHDQQSVFLSIRQADRQTSAAVAETAVNEYQKAGNAMQDKLTLTKSTSTDTRYTDNNYLNFILFQRYHSILFKKMRFRVIGILGASLALILVLKFNGSDPSKNFGSFYSLIPFFFFMMYSSSLGKDIMSLCYANCDSAMLYYPFYRQPKAILSGFFYRLKISFCYNAVIALAYFLAVFMFSLAFGGLINPVELAVFAFLLLGLTVLFSFHYLFVYYILQPFTVDGTLSSPLFKFVNYALYFISYVQLQLGDELAGWQYSAIVGVAAIIYLIVGLLVIQKKAPKTFVIKN